MGSHGHHVFSKTWDSIVFCLILVLFAIGLSQLTLAFFDEDSFQAIIKTLDLTASDVKMIPVGAVLFFMFWKFFDGLVFNKYLKLHEEREAAGSGAEVSAENKIEEAKQLTAEYEEKLHAARVEFTKEKLTKVDLAKKAAHTEISRASKQAEESLTESREKLASQAERIREDLNSQVDALSRELTDKIKQKPEPLGANT